ncbi:MULTISPECIES: ABC transporter ATP-binding protein [Corallococcus]|uniref:ABC transporter ATP-binding protein n=1 Tax=Corallococcus TaxID=83461 RepID=UPI000EC4AADC|nr:ABC transporter ATP-binding protein [Corallococcus sp. AB038B]NPC69084.1 ABC transporter ATP-binding protein [Corallococcus exiguus]NPD23057.1 ABC transporter ATP-binding protein [Corallococcus exiguus]NRD43777.1 ABC transporter ATP-binding protein [Corallococcus exiguus]RKI03920.1 ABC transporter ATP-binding protein [Corallococcus sp. AB038B]
MAPRPSAHVYRRLLGYLSPYRRLLLAGTLASLTAAAATAAYAWIVGPLLRAVLTGAPVTVAGMTLAPEALLSRLPLLVVAVALVKATAQFLQGGLMQRLGQRVMADLRGFLYGRLLAQPPAFFEQRHSGELVSRFTSDVPLVEFSVTQALSSYVRDGLQICALLATCFLIDAKLFLFTFVVVPVTVVPVSRFARSLKKVATRSQANLGALSAITAEQLQNLPVVQAYGTVPRALESFDAEAEAYLTEMRRSLFIRGAFSPTVELLGIVGVAVAVAWGARAVSMDPTLAGRLLSFMAAALLLYQPVKSLSGTLSQVLTGLAAAERLFSLADSPVPPDMGAEAPPLSRALELSGVRATYSDGREALKGVDLTIPAGARVALVGPSGAGKTTLFSVLLGFLSPSGGEVKWDGVPLSSLKASSVRAQLAWVPQEPVLFSGTVRHNLRLGQPDAPDDALWEALRLAHAEDFVRALPGGLDEPVGERGSRLSGGQRQRLALARAFLRRPSLLLLDEPTSALDATSEAAVGAGLQALMKGRTVLVIAHRLSTVRDADLIAVVEGGQVVEAGTHEQLLALRGRYARLLGEGAVAA